MREYTLWLRSLNQNNCGSKREKHVSLSVGDIESAEGAGFGYAYALQFSIAQENFFVSEFGRWRHREPLVAVRIIGDALVVF